MLLRLFVLLHVVKLLSGVRRKLSLRTLLAGQVAVRVILLMSIGSSICNGCDLLFGFNLHTGGIPILDLIITDSGQIWSRSHAVVGVIRVLRQCVLARFL